MDLRLIPRDENEHLQQETLTRTFHFLKRGLAFDG